MGLGRDQTRDPWICNQTRICSQTRYRLRYAARSYTVECEIIHLIMLKQKVYDFSGAGEKHAKK